MSQSSVFSVSLPVVQFRLFCLTAPTLVISRTTPTSLIPWYIVNIRKAKMTLADPPLMPLSELFT